MNVAVAAHPTPEPRVVRGLEALNAWAKSERWTRARKRRVLEAYHAIVKATLDAEAEAAG